MLYFLFTPFAASTPAASLVAGGVDANTLSQAVDSVTRGWTELPCASLHSAYEQHKTQTTLTAIVLPSESHPAETAGTEFATSLALSPSAETPVSFTVGSHPSASSVFTVGSPTDAITPPVAFSYVSSVHPGADAGCSLTQHTVGHSA